MNKFEIWIEGYAATGESGIAQKFGEAEGKDLADAVRNFFKGRDDAKYLNKSYTTYWGCRIFDNEADARKVFG